MRKNILENTLIKNALVILYLSILALVGSYLFFERQISIVIGDFKNLIQVDVSKPSEDILSIGYAFKPDNYDPILFDYVTRSYLVDVYEGLVKIDDNLKIVPGLAVSWGMIDSLNWEFRLRPGVKFHDGKLLSVEDVIASIERAKNDNNSQLKNLLGIIQDVDSPSNGIIRIRTVSPDPLLLSKLAATFIHLKSTNDFSVPIGTGPYVFAFGNEGQVNLTFFEDYWGRKPKFWHVILKQISNRENRLLALEKRDVQLLVDVPPLAAVYPGSKYAEIEGSRPIVDSNIEIKSIPSLEVSFIIFDVENSILKNASIRDAIGMSLDQNVFVDLAFGFAKPVTQFVSNGVFGFNPDIKKITYDLDIARKKVEDAFSSSFEKIELTFDYPKNVEQIGQYILQQLKEIGIDIILNPLDELSLIEKIRSGKSEMYYLGWKSELGDASDFFENVVHSIDVERGFGLFNGNHYSNKEMDSLIENSRKNMDLGSRLKDYQQIMKVITSDDLIGVPLFESEKIIAHLKSIHFVPRVDGYVFPSEIN